MSTASQFFLNAFGNVIIGEDAGSGLTTGGNNVIVGKKAGESIATNAASNTLIGYLAGLNGGGNNNVGVGVFALQACTGIGNTGVGESSLNSATGNYNVGVGTGAGSGVTGGEGNTILGGRAGTFTIDGDFNTLVGHDAERSGASVDGEFTLGDTNVTNLRCNDQTISSLSDGRDKKDIVDCPVGLEYINQLRPVQFTWDYREGHTKTGRTPAKQGTSELGFIAQDLKETQDSFAIPALKSYQHYPPEDSNPLDTLEADYGKLLPVAIKAIQELSTKLDAALLRIEQLESN